MPKKRGVLTPKQARFVEEYLVDLNGAAAAKRAQFRHPDKQSTQLLGKPWVKAAIKAAQDGRSERTNITADRVLREIALLSFSDVSLYEVVSGKLKLVEGAPAAAMRAVSSIKHKVSAAGVETEFRLWDKPSSLKLLCAHLGICTERKDVNLSGSLYDLIVGVKAEEDKEK